MTQISGFERSQLLLLPEAVDDYAGANNQSHHTPRHLRIKPAYAIRANNKIDRMKYTFVDCIASKILTGRSPKILKALRFSPGEPQDGLKPISIFGNDAY